MKTNTLHQHLCLLSLLFITMLGRVVAQDYPPAQGPPLPPSPANQLGTFVIINLVETSIKTTIDTVNARIEREKPNTGVSARVHFTMETFKPGRSVTMLKDQPNQNIVRIAFMIKYNITDIKYKGIPYFNRSINQSIDVFIACKDWFTNNGVLNISSDIQKPYLDNASFSEQALNFFMANKLTDLVDSQLRNTLPSAMRTSNDVSTSPCNCLGLNPGTPAAKYKDGEILYALKKSNRPIGAGTSTFSTASVSLVKIKRLKARSLPGSQFLYNEVENIQLTFYVNNTARHADISNIREGEERALNIQGVSFNKPADNETIVLIANIEQQPLTSTLKDTRFAVYNKSVNFGNGTQQLVVTKSYWSKPQRLPGGGMSKPREIKVPAYEITVQVQMPPNNVVRN